MLYISETFINETLGYLIDKTPLTETQFDKPGDLFRSLRSEYGKPSKMYKDGPKGEAIQTGWVFTGRDKYDDSPKDTYIRQVWVSVYSAPPDVIHHPFTF